MSKFNTAWLKKVINGISTKVFVISHAKSTYYDYDNNKTVYDKIQDMDKEIDKKSNNTHRHDNATKTKDGFMSSVDKTKLDDIDTGANKTIVDSVLSSTSTNPVQNKIVKAELDKKSDNGHSHDYIPMSGSTNITGDLEFPNSGTTMRGIGGLVGDNDYWRVKGGATGSNTGF